MRSITVHDGGISAIEANRFKRVFTPKSIFIRTFIPEYAGDSGDPIILTVARARKFATGLLVMCDELDGKR